MSVAEASNSIEQAKHGGDHSSRAAQLQARRNEQKALSLWIKGATFQQIAAAGFGIATAGGAWRSVHRALAQIPKQEADQAREAQLRGQSTLPLVCRPSLRILHVSGCYRWSIAGELRKH
jgi:hypothetical protein